MKLRSQARTYIIRNHAGLTVCGLAAVLLVTPLGLNLFIGYAGQISLGHGAFSDWGFTAPPFSPPSKTNPLVLEAYLGRLSLTA